MKQRVAVVGGGVAGLAAAWRLAESGAAVTLYEARPEPGGRVRSDHAEGSIADTGVQLVGSSFRSFFGLVGAAGAGGALVRAPGRDALWRNGRAKPLTYGSMSSMVASGALPTGLKLRLGTRYLPFLARHARGLDVGDPAGTGGAALDVESVAAWGRREMGEDFVERMAYPLLASYYGAAPEDASAAIMHALAQAGMDVQVYAAEGGMGALVLAITRSLEAKGVEFRTAEGVTGLEAGPDAVRLESDGGSDAYDGVVLATPAAAAAALLGDGADPALRAWLGGVRMRPTVVLALYLDAPTGAEWFGLSFPRTDPIGRQVAAVCLQGRKLGRLVARGREVAVVLPAPALGEALVDAEPDRVVDALLPSVLEALPGLDRTVARARTHTFEDGYTLFPAGHIRAIAAFDPAWLPARVALAGDYLVSPTVEGAVRSGYAAAERLAGGSGAGGPAGESRPGAGSAPA